MRTIMIALMTLVGCGGFSALELAGDGGQLEGDAGGGAEGGAAAEGSPSSDAAVLEDGPTMPQDAPADGGMHALCCMAGSVQRAICGVGNGFSCGTSPATPCGGEGCAIAGVCVFCAEGYGGPRQPPCDQNSTLTGRVEPCP